MAAEEGVATVLLSEFLAEVRDLLASEEQDQGVEESVSSHIQSNYGLNWYYLLLKLDAPLPEDVLDERIFDSLVTCPRIAGIVIPHTVEASCVPRMLRRALEKLPNRQLITFHPAFPLSEAEAEEIFEDILTSGANHNIFFTIRYDEGVMRVFTRYIRECTQLKYLNLVDWNRPQTGMTHIVFASLFEAIGDSVSIKNVHMKGAFVAEPDLAEATRTLANSIANSSSLVELILADEDKDGAFSMNDVCRELSRTPSVQNFDLCFEKTNNNRFLKLSRTNRWKSLLPQNIPLSFWPHILAKANTWKSQTSHSSLDALLFLMREKSDVLLQNVHRRRIRKRKRFQFGA